MSGQDIGVVIMSVIIVITLIASYKFTNHDHNNK